MRTHRVALQSEHSYSSANKWEPKITQLPKKWHKMPFRDAGEHVFRSTRVSFSERAGRFLERPERASLLGRLGPG
jgi:hypothetical protein